MQSSGNHSESLADVGSYGSSPSHYGTYDQGGNVWEWTEGFLSLEEEYDHIRILRGSSIHYDYPDASRSDQRLSQTASNMGFTNGFRIVRITAIPEP